MTLPWARAFHDGLVALPADLKGSAARKVVDKRFWASSS
jgi:hypothetical protein